MVKSRFDTVAPAAHEVPPFLVSHKIPQTPPDVYGFGVAAVNVAPGGVTHNFPCGDAKCPNCEQLHTTDSLRQHRTMQLPTDPAARKATPITKGVLDYFPLALAEVARVSKAGNDQHNPGQPLHWDKTKSMDHADCIARHLIDRGTFDPTDSPPQRHSAKLAWRALALLQIELEQEQPQ